MTLKFKNFIFTALILGTLNYSAWSSVLAAGQHRAGFYFLNVGQGDSELTVFSSGAKLLTDAGPDKSATAAMEGVLGQKDNYIDLGLITHAQLDHYGGYINLLDNYNFGAILWNGKGADSGSREWSALMSKIKAKNIQLIVLQKGDKIISGEESSVILSPDAKLLAGKDANESGLVQKISIAGESAILTADIAKKAETEMLSSGQDLRADIYKVPHHGSKTSVNNQFVAAINPTIAAIEVGKKNRYGHPTAEALNELIDFGIKTIRTDLSGTVSVFPGNSSLLVKTDY